MCIGTGAPIAIRQWRLSSQLSVHCYVFDRIRSSINPPNSQSLWAAATGTPSLDLPVARPFPSTRAKLERIYYINFSIPCFKNKFMHFGLIHPNIPSSQRGNDNWCHSRPARIAPYDTESWGGAKLVMDDCIVIPCSGLLSNLDSITVISTVNRSSHYRPRLVRVVWYVSPLNATFGPAFANKEYIWSRGFYSSIKPTIVSNVNWLGLGGLPCAGLMRDGPDDF